MVAPCALGVSASGMSFRAEENACSMPSVAASLTASASAVSAAVDSDDGDDFDSVGGAPTALAVTASLAASAAAVSAAVDSDDGDDFDSVGSAPTALARPEAEGGEFSIDDVSPGVVHAGSASVSDVASGGSERCSSESPPAAETPLADTFSKESEDAASFEARASLSLSIGSRTSASAALEGTTSSVDDDMFDRRSDESSASPVPRRASSDDTMVGASTLASEPTAYVLPQPSPEAIPDAAFEIGDEDDEASGDESDRTSGADAGSVNELDDVGAVGAYDTQSAAPMGTGDAESTKSGSGTHNDFGSFGGADSPAAPAVAGRPSPTARNAIDLSGCGVAGVTAHAEAQDDDSFCDFGAGGVVAHAETKDDEFGDFEGEDTTTQAVMADGDFGAFGSNGADEADVENEDDFGDFGGRSALQSSAQDDDFGDSGGGRASQPVGNDDDDDFGDFGGGVAQGDDDDFGNFGGSSTAQGVADASFGTFGSGSTTAALATSGPSPSARTDELLDAAAFEGDAEHLRCAAEAMLSRALSHTGSFAAASGEAPLNMTQLLLQMLSATPPSPTDAFPWDLTLWRRPSEEDLPWHGSLIQQRFVAALGLPAQAVEVEAGGGPTPTRISTSAASDARALTEGGRPGEDVPVAPPVAMPSQSFGPVLSGLGSLESTPAPSVMFGNPPDTGLDVFDSQTPAAPPAFAPIANDDFGAFGSCQPPPPPQVTADDDVFGISGSNGAQQQSAPAPATPAHPAGVSSMLDFDLLSSFGTSSAVPSTSATPIADPFMADFLSPTAPAPVSASQTHAGVGATGVAEWLENLPSIGYMLSSTLVLPSA